MVFFQITIDNLNPRWVSSLMIGVLCSPVTRSLLPVTAFGFKKDAWIIAGDSVYHNGHKVHCLRFFLASCLLKKLRIYIS